MKFNDQVAYICVDCKKGFRRHQLTPVRKYVNKKTKYLKCDVCIEKEACRLINETVVANNLTQAYKFLFNMIKGGDLPEHEKGY